jgi:hypothetical protein
MKGMKGMESFKGMERPSLACISLFKLCDVFMI